MPDRRGPDRQVRYGRIVGLFFLVAGFIAIGLGWNGMAKEACPDCQLPFLLSGGATGLGLILLGSVLLLMAQVRDERMKLGEQIRDVGTAITKAVSAPAAGIGSGQLVVIGKSTYHRPSCRLVEGKADADLVSVEVARLQGLSPCRVCDPPVPDEDGSGEKAKAAEAAEGSSPPAKKTGAKSSARR